MSSEDDVREHVKNELKVAKRVCRVWKTQMTNAYWYLHRAGAVAQNVKDEYERHNSMYAVIMEEQDIHEIKRATVCMTMFVETLFHHFNTLISSNLNAMM